MHGDLMLTVEGRALAVTVAGSPSGPVILYHHGSTGGRTSVRLLDEAAAALGLTVVGIDRPGYGLSDPHRFTLASVAADSVAVAAALCVEEVRVLGQSSGAAYALATAALHPQLVAGVALGGAAIPLEPGTAAWARLSDDERLGLTLIERDEDEAERLLGLEDAEFARECHDADEEDLLLEVLGERLTTSTPHELRAARWKAAALKDGLRQGMAGWGRDNVVRMPSWDLPLHNIGCSVTAWFGETERDVEEKVAWLRERIPALRPRIVAGSGHDVMFEHARSVLSDLPGSPV